MRAAALFALLAITACDPALYDDGTSGGLPIPTGVSYQVEPVGTGTAPAGILITWDDTYDSSVYEWHVYSRASAGDPFLFRGATNSTSYHDRGAPYLQYYVVSADYDGYESAPSTIVTVNEYLALPKPTWLASTSLNGAVALNWSDNAYASEPGAFSHYRVYGAHYDLDAGLCSSDWSLEGTTVAPEFIVGALGNGVPRCFAVTAISVEGYESLWSPVKDDTPRPDARNIVLYAHQYQDAGSGFRFWQDIDDDGRADGNEIGLIKNGSSVAADFSVERTADNALWLKPRRGGTTLAIYGAVPVGDLTDIDWAPLTGYSTASAQALPGWGYVFETDGGDGYARYGAVRVTHVGKDFLILDWAYQTDPGNPELVAAR